MSLIERCALFRASLSKRLHCTFIKDFCWCSGLFAYICDAYSETWRPYGPDHELKQCVVSCVTMMGHEMVHGECVFCRSSDSILASLHGLSQFFLPQTTPGSPPYVKIVFQQNLTFVNANSGRTHVVNTVSRQPWQITKVHSIGVFINFV